MRLDVVWWHGHYRSLNNRHLAALKLSGVERCCVRLWPLTPGLNLVGSPNSCVVRKFIKSQSSSVGGRTIRLVDRALCPGSPAASCPEVPQENEIDRQEHQYLTLNSASYSSVMSREDCWINETYFLTPSGVLQPVEAIRAGDQVCAANGQVLQIKKAERLPRENRNLVHMKTEYAELVVTSNHKARLVTHVCHVVWVSYQVNYIYCKIIGFVRITVSSLPLSIQLPSVWKFAHAPPSFVCNDPCFKSSWV